MIEHPVHIESLAVAPALLEDVVTESGACCADGVVQQVGLAAVTFGTIDGCGAGPHHDRIAIGPHLYE